MNSSTNGESKAENKKTLERDIDKLYDVIEKLEYDIDRYVNHCETMWSEYVIPFINSGDCLTITKLDTGDSHKFLDFMLGHKEYKLMRISLARLYDKLNYSLKYYNENFC